MGRVVFEVEWLQRDGFWWASPVAFVGKAG